MSETATLELLRADLRRQAFSSAQQRYAREATFFSAAHLSTRCQQLSVARNRGERELREAQRNADDRLARKISSLGDDNQAQLLAFELELTSRSVCAPQLRV